jgi:dTDP-glucose 4,6-dehydratase
MKSLLVTGGAGFIGSAFVRLAAKKGYEVIVVDKLTYAGDLARLAQVRRKFKFYKADICDRKQIESIFKKEKPEIVVHFAAESHVDRSIRDASSFLKTNIQGTQIILDIAKKHKIERFIHISTDEVYGDRKRGEFSEESVLRPSNPYSASKAGADLLVKSYIRTYKFPAIIVRPCNNYGPWQYPEKLIPLSIFKIVKNKKIPIYAKGKNVREWLFVQDCAEGILQILKKGKPGEIYNLGSGREKQNIQVARMLLRILKAPPNLIQFIKDRPGHDIRYSLDSRKVHKETGWQPKVNFEKGLESTVQWCLKNKDWLLNKWKNIAPLYK